MSTLISNMIARLSMDSRPFEQNATRARQSMHGMATESLTLQRGMAGLAAAGAKIAVITAAAYGAYRGIKSLASASIEAERAERGLGAAIEVSGQNRATMLPILKNQAEQLQDLTRYARDEIMTQQAFALTMGASAEEIDSMTRAAIGLSAAYGKDLHASMRTISLARQGETGQLKEMGIVLDKTRNRYQQYLQLLQIGRKNFSMAKEDAKTLGGSLDQLANEWKETKDILVRPFVPAIVGVLRATREAMEATRESGVQLKVTLEDLARAGSEGGLIPNMFTGAGRGPALSPLNLGQPRGPILPQPGAPIVPIQAPTPIRPVSEKITELNRALKEQIEIQMRVNEGDKQAAEVIRFKTAAMDAYDGNMDDVLAAMTKYESGLARLAEIQRSAEVDKYVQSLRDESIVLETLSHGEEVNAEILRTIIDLRKQLGDLTQDEIDAISDLIRKNDELAQTIERNREQQRQWTRIAQDGVEGVSDALARTIVYGEKLSDLFKRLALDIVYTALRTSIANAIGAGLGGMGLSINTMHSGGIVGQSAGPARIVSPIEMAMAPRAHSGLASDEFPVVLQRGERVQSRTSVGNDNRAMDRMVMLLEQLVNKPATNVAVVHSREEIYDALRHRDGHRLIAEINARNG